MFNDLAKLTKKKRLYANNYVSLGVLIEGPL